MNILKKPYSRDIYYDCISNCPYCDKTQMNKGVPQVNTQADGRKYLCNNCGEPYRVGVIYKIVTSKLGEGE